MSHLSILDRTGHTEVTWGPDDGAALAEAQAAARTAVAYTGGAIIRTDAPGGETVVRELGPEGEYVIIPQFAGG
jgi:hypothetical protein